MELIGGRYEVLSEVRSSPSSTMLRARDLQHDRAVALKVYPLGTLERTDLLAEAGTLLRLPPHPGLPIVRDDFFLEDRYVIVIDWVEGTDLARLLEDRGAPGLVPSEVVDYIDQAARALEHLHGQIPLVVHGDVKPSNLIVTPVGNVVLVDFGLATTGRNASNGGTRGFTAPEVLAGGPATPAADVYGLAATAVTLLTGRPPGGASPSWEGVDPEDAGFLSRALKQALSTDPARRPSSATEFAERLKGGRGLPSGVLTFLCTELDQAAELWSADPEAMAAAVGRLDDLFCACVGQQGGHVLQSMGDGEHSLAAFAQASAAVAAGLAIHQRLASERWSGGLSPRLRVGVHTGEAVARNGSYVGAATVHATRVRSMATPGTTAVSFTTATLLGSRLPRGVQVVGTWGTPERAGDAMAAPAPAMLRAVGPLDSVRGSREPSSYPLMNRRRGGVNEGERDRLQQERARVDASVRQALRMAAEAEQAGHQDRGRGFRDAAERFAQRLIDLERRTEDA